MFARDIWIMRSNYIIKSVIKTVGVFCFLFSFSVFSQENSSEFTTEYSPLSLGASDKYSYDDNTVIDDFSAVELLRQARLIRRSNAQQSIKLALEALRISNSKKEYRLIGQSHSLLGDIFDDIKDLSQAREHFLQASIVYKSINDKRSQIRLTINYIDVLFDEKKYTEGMDVASDLLFVAKDYGEDHLVASVLAIKGDGYRKERYYKEAISEYKTSLDYLINQDDVVQSKLATIYHQIAQCHKHLHDYENSIYFYKNALHVYMVLQDQKAIASTLKNIADIERNRRNYVISLDFSLRGIEIQKKLNDPKSLAKALRGLGITYRRFGRYEKAIKYINEAYLIYKEENNVSETAEASNQLGLIYTKLKQFDEAKSFYQLTISLPENEVDIKTLATALREISVINLEEGNLELSLKMARRAHKIYQDKNLNVKSSQTARIIGKIYRRMSNDDQAIKYFRESLLLAEEAGNEQYQVKSLTQLGSALIGKNTDEAVFVFKKSLELAVKNNMLSAQLYIYRFLRRAEKGRGNILESLRFAEKEIDLSLLIQKEIEKKEISKAKAKLDSHKKEMELTTLREKIKLGELELAQKSSEMEIVKQANRISELELTKNKYASFALTALLIICLIAALYIYKIFIASRKRNKELDYLAARDPLTNCYNRRFLSDLMSRDFSDLELLGEYSVIMADIDHFKMVNDNHGHNTGDTVLRGVSNTLQNNIRQNDVAARYGGEEFCIILPGAAIEQATRIAETIRQKVERSSFNSIKVTCSFGITSIRFNAKTPTELIGQADMALYQSKINGRNRVTLWDKSFDAPETKTSCRI